MSGGIDEISEKGCKYMSIQDRNAGNAGDLLKHALLLDLLDRLPVNPDQDWSYTETHAGAGLFSTPLAETIYVGAQIAESAGLEGQVYADALLRWRRDWLAGNLGFSRESEEESDPRHVPYPGSPLLAWRSGSINGRFQLAEVEEASRERLNRALGGEVAIEASSFEDALDRLFAPDRLIALIDPFYYESQARDGEDGRLGRGHLVEITGRLSSKDAVLLIFSSNLPKNLRPDGAAGERERARGTWRSLRDDLRELSPPALRGFLATGTSHAVLAAGWGAGEALVDGLPDESDWSRSWLAAPPVGLNVTEV